MIKLIRNNIKEIFFFGVVGVFATVTHYICALMAHEQVHLNLYAANLVGYLCAVAVSFIGHSLLTFNVGLKLKFLGPFVLVSVSTFLFSECILWILEKSIQLDHRISIGIVVVTIPVISYILNKCWVYKSPAGH